MHLFLMLLLHDVVFSWMRF